MSAAHIIISSGGGAGGRSPIAELSNGGGGPTFGKVRARHSFFSFFLGTLFGNIVLLVIMSMSLCVFGALAWMAAGCGAYSCDDYPADFDSAWWLSWGLHFDPGTQTGINAKEGPAQKWVAVSFSIMGFILNLIFLGILVETIRQVLDNWRRFYGRIIENGHTVVLGWTDKTLFLLGELAEMMTDSQAGGGTIVVLGELDTVEMRTEVAIAFPDWRKRWKRVRVRYYNGKPYELDDLLKVAVYAAERVIVLGCSRQPRVADSQVLTTICALRCLPGNKTLNPATTVIAELKQRQNEPVVLHIGGEGEELPAAPAAGAAADAGGEAAHESTPLSITPVVGNFAANALMSLSALDPSAGLALLDLMNFSGDQIETIPCDTFTNRGATTTTFGALRNSFTEATPLGLKIVSSKDGAERIVLAPPDSHVIDGDTYLLVIALDITTALNSSKAASTEAIKRQNTMRTIRSPTRLVTAVSRMLGSGRRAMQAVGVEPADGSGGASAMPPEAADPAVTRERGARRRVVLFVGWQRGFESLLRLLDARLPPGSEVYILSEQSERARTLELNAEGLSLDGSPTGDEGDEKGLVNCRLEHVYGYTTDERAMRRLPLARADAAVVVADTNEDDAGGGLGEGGGGAELQIADSEALTSTILLRRLHAEISLGQKDAPTLTIVTEFVDLLTRRLLERQGSLITRAPAPRSSPSSGAAVMKVEAVEGDGASSGGGGEVQPVVFHRNYIETTALSLASHSATSWLTVQMLLDPHSGYAIASVRVGDAAALPELAKAPTGDASSEEAVRSKSPSRHSFAELSDMLVGQGLGLLIGWRRGSGGEVEINPSDKSKALAWIARDELIVLRGPASDAQGS